jgi:hypothetical protein
MDSGVEMALQENNVTTLGRYDNDYPLSHKSLQSAWRKWFADLKFDYFVTLTFPEEVSEEYAKEKMRR